MAKRNFFSKLVSAVFGIPVAAVVITASSIALAASEVVRTGVKHTFKRKDGEKESKENENAKAVSEFFKGVIYAAAGWATAPYVDSVAFFTGKMEEAQSQSGFGRFSRDDYHFEVPKVKQTKKTDPKKEAKLQKEADEAFAKELKTRTENYEEAHCKLSSTKEQERKKSESQDPSGAVSSATAERFHDAQSHFAASDNQPVTVR